VSGVTAERKTFLATFRDAVNRAKLCVNRFNASTLL
jgi:hypothetical protein